jgi:hypothetical protein
MGALQPWTMPVAAVVVALMPGLAILSAPRIAWLVVAASSQLRPVRGNGARIARSNR